MRKEFHPLTSNLRSDAQADRPDKGKICTTSLALGERTGGIISYLLLNAAEFGLPCKVTVNKMIVLK